MSGAPDMSGFKYGGVWFDTTSRWELRQQTVEWVETVGPEYHHGASTGVNFPAGPYALCAEGKSGNKYHVRTLTVNGVNGAEFLNASLWYEMDDGVETLNVHGYRARHDEEFVIKVHGYGLDLESDWPQNYVWLEHESQNCDTSNHNGFITDPNKAFSRGTAGDTPSETPVTGQLFLGPFFQEAESGKRVWVFRGVSIPFGGRFHLCWENPFSEIKNSWILQSIFIRGLIDSEVIPYPPVLTEQFSVTVNERTDEVRTARDIYIEPYEIYPACKLHWKMNRIGC